MEEAVGPTPEEVEFIYLFQRGRGTRPMRKCEKARCRGPIGSSHPFLPHSVASLAILRQAGAPRFLTLWLPSPPYGQQ